MKNFLPKMKNSFTRQVQNCKEKTNRITHLHIYYLGSDILSFNILKHESAINLIANKDTKFLKIITER